MENDFGYRLRELERKAEKHEQDLYKGNGKPALTVRIALMEDCVEKISRNLSKITWILIAALVTAAADIIVRGVR